jgi:alkanesulfonate monooxygenase SsuD/methylene tetrahydromethanopterin reductase-like flavin-dependent oxidoreductase (luciferase family)
LRARRGRCTRSPFPGVRSRCCIECLLPGVAEGARRAGRDPSEIDLIIPVIVAAGDTPEERANPIVEAKTTIGFYGATPNYAFQFDDLGHTGMRDQLRDCLRAGDNARVQALITPTRSSTSSPWWRAGTTSPTA